jgi:ABC-2 type transport system ATP-binding protein
MKSRTESVQPCIEIRNLEVRRGGRLVLPGINLEIRTAAVTGLLGPGGCGKTTLMRAIVGTQKVAGGTVMVLGQPAGVSGLRKRVGYVTQLPSVYSDLTVRENLTYYARVVGVPVSRVEDVIADVGLSKHRDQVVSTLSGGERSRASLAGALLGNPDVLILDEPTVGLDPLIRRDMWRIFHGLAGMGIVILVSTHVMDEADRCDDLVLMRAGRIISTGTPQELRKQAGSDDLEEAFIRLASA